MTAAAQPGRPRLAFVSPRLHEGGTAGGAETLLHSLARDAAAAGCAVEFLTTCARDHHTWRNELPEGAFEREGLTVRRFPVNPGRDAERFLALQSAISRGERLSDDEEAEWLRHSVNSDALTAHLEARGDSFDRVLAGPYLFGLTAAAAAVRPDRTLLVPCLHDEPFARVRRIARMFGQSRGCLFNTEPERLLAHRLMPDFAPRVEAVVAMGLPDFTADPAAFARRSGLTEPYLLYSGRREPLKGTPLLLDYLDAYRQRRGRAVKLVLTGSGDVDCPEGLRPHLLDLGFVDEATKREVMAGAAVFCHPSTNESLSIVLLEAWLAGTPALVHARGEVLRWQCRAAQGGLWFGNYPEFEEALTLLLDRPALRKALAANGRGYTLRQYAPERVLERFLEALRQ